MIQKTQTENIESRIAEFNTLLRQISTATRHYIGKDAQGRHIVQEAHTDKIYYVARPDALYTVIGAA